MQLITIQALPNQKFSIPLDSNEWGISIKDANGAICFSLTLNGSIVIENIRAVAGMRIIPAQYEEAGNFALITQDQEIPDYTQFGITQSLVYISQDELNAIRSDNPIPITASDFDPLGALPLRFAPQGYTLV